MTATDYFLHGNSCSESIILDSCDKGYCTSDTISLASGFSGGIGSGCLCGAVSASIMVLGCLFGKNNKHNNPPIAKQLSKEFMTEFLKTHKASCCRVLSKGLEFSSQERKDHCCNIVEYCSNLLETVIEKEMVNNG